MISLCTVVTDRIIERYLKRFLDSIAEHTKLVKEVIIVNCEHEGNYEEYNIRKDIVVKTFNHHINQRTYQHPLGLHHAVDQSTQEYILFSDPDLYFYTAADEIYKNLMDKYNLFIVGISHHSSLCLATRYFPYVQNCFIKKDKLPGPDFLKGKLKMRHMLVPTAGWLDDNFPPLDGKYLIHGPIPGLWEKFPYPELTNSYETGCNLYLHCEEIGGKWLSFQTLDCHNYTTKIYRNNFKLKANLGNVKLIYHETNGHNKQDYKI